MKILHLTLKKKWFDMILSGEKKEEYREIKPYWITRLSQPYVPGKVNSRNTNYDIVRFRNGYGKNSPAMDIMLERIDMREGNESWGASPGVSYFVLVLGNIISTIK